MKTRLTFSIDSDGMPRGIPKEWVTPILRCPVSHGRLMGGVQAIKEWREAEPHQAWLQEKRDREIRERWALEKTITEVRNPGSPMAKRWAEFADVRNSR